MTERCMTPFSSDYMRMNLSIDQTYSRVSHDDYNNYNDDADDAAAADDNDDDDGGTQQNLNKMIDLVFFFLGGGGCRLHAENGGFEVAPNKI